MKQLVVATLLCITIRFQCFYPTAASSCARLSEPPIAQQPKYLSRRRQRKKLKVMLITQSIETNHSMWVFKLYVGSRDLLTTVVAFGSRKQFQIETKVKT